MPTLSRQWHRKSINVSKNGLNSVLKKVFWQKNFFPFVAWWDDKKRPKRFFFHHFSPSQYWYQSKMRWIWSKTNYKTCEERTCLSSSHFFFLVSWGIFQKVTMTFRNFFSYRAFLWTHYIREKVSLFMLQSDRFTNEERQKNGWR